MYGSLPKGIFLFLILASSIFTTTTFAVAQEKVVEAKSIGFEETTIIEFENKGTTEIQTIRMWLGEDNAFKSFKTEKGWTGKKTLQGVLVFTTSESIKPGQSVKFGVKTAESMPGINWKAVDTNDNQLQIGKTLVSEYPSKPSQDVKTISPEGDSAILTDSTFRLVPERPNVGSTIRVLSVEKFASNQEFDFYIGNRLLESFETNQDGHFMFTTKIPDNEKAERINFIVKDKQGFEKSLSLRIGESPGVMVYTEERPLTISEIPPVLHRNDKIKVAGTASPGGTIVATIKDFNGNIVSTIDVDVDSRGIWEYNTTVAADTLFGKYSAEITDGKNTILRSWEIKSDKKIQIFPAQVRYEPGDIIVFNGTAIPDQQLEVIIEDPTGKEVYYEILDVGTSGQVYLEFSTELSSIKGTYVLYASQTEENEIILVGLGQLPQEVIIVKVDRTNYSAGDIVKITIQGEPSTNVNFLIIDPGDRAKLSEIITLGPDGNYVYELDLLGYASGVYTAIAKRGGSQGSDVFSIGLQIGSGPIEVKTIKQTFLSGDSILILGESGNNILLTLSLRDPEGLIIKEKEIFTNKEGLFSENSFRIPADATEGVWILRVQSGNNFKELKLKIIGDVSEGLIFTSLEVEQYEGREGLRISGTGAEGTTLVIDIFGVEGEKMDTLSIRITKDGDFTTVWFIPKEINPGQYTIQIKDNFNSVNATYVLE